MSGFTCISWELLNYKVLRLVVGMAAAVEVARASTEGGLAPQLRRG